MPPVLILCARNVTYTNRLMEVLTAWLHIKPDIGGRLKAYIPTYTAPHAKKLSISVMADRSK